jgi:hypothetical protein
VSGGDDRGVRVWDLEAQAALHTFSEARGSVHVVRFHPDGAAPLALLDAPTLRKPGIPSLHLVPTGLPLSRACF